MGNTFGPNGFSPASTRLLLVVLGEIELMEFFPKDKPLQQEIPWHERVPVFNADTGINDKSIPVEDFLNDLRAISNSSVFKK